MDSYLLKSFLEPEVLIPLLFATAIIAFVVWAVISGLKEEKEWAKKRDVHKAWLKDNGYGNVKRLSTEPKHFIDLCEERQRLIIDERSYSYDEIISCELVTKENSTVKTSGGISRAIVGGVLAGGVGAVVGANTASKSVSSETVITGLKLYFNDVSNPSRTLELTREAALATYDALFVIFSQKKDTPKVQEPNEAGFCPKCGTALQTGDIFCRKCGTKVTE